MATDPPYLVNYQGGNRPQSGHNRPEVKDKHWDDYDEATGADFFSSFLRVALEHALGDHVAIYQWHAYRRQALVEQAWIENGLLVHQQIIWVKKRAVPARTHYMWQHESCFYGWVEGKQPVRRPPNNVTTVWEVDQKGERDGIHPTQKPVKLFADPIQYHLRQGGLCYEPFAGSGTCIVAAERLNRRCYAMELAPTYCDVIVERWQNLTGERAVREDGTTFDDAKTQARQAV